MTRSLPPDLSLELLHSLRAASGPAKTTGLPDEVVARFASRDARLVRAIEAAWRARQQMDATWDSFFRLPEAELCRTLQAGILNFYPKTSVNPYVPLAAEGPWIVTAHGAVLHDSGGYGMLGSGHAPEAVVASLAQPHVMANVMTPSFSQYRLTERLAAEIGRRRGSCPFGRFVFLNSGSEAVSFACRVADIHAAAQVGPGGPHEGQRVMRLALVDGFHGRTEGPARLSHSCRPAYTRHLASFDGPDGVVFVPMNDEPALERAFSEALDRGVFFEAAFVEPVMGEGVPGLAMSAAYYRLLRRLTAAMGSLLVVDSIQAALRAQGCLSVVDYPGFESEAPPDIETYSKALNAGQFPLSVVALREEVAASYVTGLYGNTMTGNPRAMEVACAVLDAITDDLRDNIRERGEELRAALSSLAEEFPGAVQQVVGTGLMVSIMLDPARYRVLGEGGLEEHLRIHGIEMIHGGESGLRFTPPFDVTSEEIQLIASVVRSALAECAAAAAVAAAPAAARGRQVA
jgi:acetylornithine/succinyldiaminopimelate/putrescine aminotransferase